MVAQGSEAGGHRGTFAGPFEAAMVGTMALVPQVVDAVAVPVVAAGGIMDGLGIVAARPGRRRGPDGDGVPDLPRGRDRRILQGGGPGGGDDQTAVTRAFSGRPARALVNEFVRPARPGAGDFALPAPERGDPARAGLRGGAGNTRFLSLWAGQAASLARGLPAADLVAELVGRPSNAS